MSNKQSFASSVSDSELNSNIVALLADRPNLNATYGQGGLSPAQLKAWFDKLGRLLAGKLNSVVSKLESANGANYVGLTGLDSTITCVSDLVDACTGGKLAELIMLKASADATSNTALQTVVNNFAESIATITTTLDALESSAGADSVGIADTYDGANKTVQDVIDDVLSGAFASKIKVQYNNALTALSSIVSDIEGKLAGTTSSGLKTLINACYTKNEADALLLNKVDTSTYSSEQNAQNLRLTSLESDVGDIDDITFATSIVSALNSLNEDIDSLQLGVVPRIVRGSFYTGQAETLNDALKSRLSSVVQAQTGRDTPDNTDAVSVIDSDTGIVYTYYYWAAPDVSEVDGWFLAATYASPAVTDIPNYSMNIVEGTWTSEADDSGLYYIVVSPTSHGMGTTNTIDVVVRVVTPDGYVDLKSYFVTADGNIVVYSDTKFTGVLVVRVGNAYRLATLEADNITGLHDVATSGNYNNLINKPTLSAVAGSGNYNDLLNKPTLSAVAGSGNYNDLSGKPDLTNIVEKDENGKIPSSLLPGYVDDVLEYVNLASFPVTGESGKIYIDKTTNKSYRWSGSIYVEISSSLSLGETSSTAYAGNKGKANRDDIDALLNGTKSAKSAEKATKDNQGRNISDTYTTGCIIEKNSITVQVRVTEKTNPAANQTFDLFRDSPTPFNMDVVTVRDIGNNQKSIIAGSICRQILVGSNRYDYDYLLLHLPAGYSYPKFVRLVSEVYSNGNVHNLADISEEITVGGVLFRRYNLFDEGYDFCNEHYISLEFIY